MSCQDQNGNMSYQEFNAKNIVGSKQIFYYK